MVRDCAVILMLTLAFTFAAAAQTPPADLPVLSRAFGGSPQQADFVVMLDRSGTMDRFWGGVTEGVAAFAGAVPEGDYLSVLYFDERSDYLLTPRAIRNDTRSALQQEIRQLPRPRGQKTDLGRASDRIIDEFNRPNRNRLQFAFAFTDFIHEPPVGSPWMSLDPASQAWRQLAAKRETVLDRNGHIYRVYALRLPLGGRVGRDMALFRGVFPEAEEVSVVDGRSLREWFDQRRAEIARDRIRLQAEEEIRRGGLVLEMATVRLHDGRRVERQAVLRSLYRVVAVEVDGVATDSGPGLVQLTGIPDGPVRLAPGSEIPVRVAVSCSGACSSIWPGRISVSVPLKAVVRYRLLPEGEFRILGVVPERAWDTPLTLSAVVVCGWPWWWFVLGLAAVVTGAWGLWREFRPAYLFGRIQDEVRPPGCQGVDVTFRRNARSRSITVGTRQADIPLAGGGRDAGVKLVARRKPKRGVYLEVVEGEATLDGRYLARGCRERLRLGNSLIGLAGYKLRWK